METTVDPTESVWVPLPPVQMMMAVSAVIADGQSGGGAFHLSLPGLDKDYAVVDGVPWTLDFPNLGVVDARVTNTGSTTLVFTSPDP